VIVLEFKNYNTYVHVPDILGTGCFVCVHMYCMQYEYYNISFILWKLKCTSNYQLSNFNFVDFYMYSNRLHMSEVSQYQHDAFNEKDYLDYSHDSALLKRSDPSQE